MTIIDIHLENDEDEKDATERLKGWTRQNYDINDELGMRSFWMISAIIGGTRIQVFSRTRKEDDDDDIS